MAVQEHKHHIVACTFPLQTLLLGLTHPCPDQLAESEAGLCLVIHTFFPGGFGGAVPRTGLPQPALCVIGQALRLALHARW